MGWIELRDRRPLRNAHDGRTARARSAEVCPNVEKRGGSGPFEGRRGPLPGVRSADGSGNFWGWRLHPPYPRGIGRRLRDRDPRGVHHRTGHVA